MKKIIFFFIILLPVQLSACLNAHSFKIFPLGMTGDTIISVDIHMWRSDSFFLEEGEEKGNVSVNTFSSSDFKWKIKTYITKYDRYQHPIEALSVDSAIFSKDDCTDILFLLYERAFNKVKKEYETIELFKPIEISFYDGVSECGNIKLSDAVIRYNKNEYPIAIINDPTYHGFDADSEYHEIMTTPPLPPIYSVRKYRTSNFELVVLHLQSGQSVDKSEKLSVEFNDIGSAIYQEPLLYHGHGYDLFVLESI